MHAVATKKTIHSKTPHQVSKGIRRFPNEYDEANTVMILVITIITQKNVPPTVVIPATKHKRSSGKNGKRNINVRTILSFPFIEFNAARSFSLPISHSIVLAPNSLPIKNATKDPAIMPTQLYTAPRNAPNNNTPAPTVIKDGIGIITTCKNCKSIK